MKSSTVIALNEYRLTLNFAEIMAIESNLPTRSMSAVVATIPSVEENILKHLLLKVASCYVELYQHRNDLDKESSLVLTEEELLILRDSVPQNIVFNNVPISPLLKRKILEGIVILNSVLPEDLMLSDETGPTKYDLGEQIIDWMRHNP